MTQAGSGIRIFRKRLGIVLIGIMVLTMAVCGVLIRTFTAKAAGEYSYQQLTEKAIDSAVLIDTHIQNYYHILGAIAALPVIADPTVPFTQKALFLEHFDQSSTVFQRVYLADMDGKEYSSTGTTGYADARCVVAAQKQKGFITEPVSGENGLVCIVSVPVVYNGSAAGVLIAEVPAKSISDILDSVHIAQTGTVAVMNETGTLIASPDFKLVERQMNILEESSEKTGLEDYAAFARQALTHTTGSGSYTFLGHKFTAAFATLRTTGWTVIVKAPELECTFIFQRLSALIAQTGSIISITVFILIFFISCALAEQLLHRQQSASAEQR